MDIRRRSVGASLSMAVALLALPLGSPPASSAMVGPGIAAVQPVPAHKDLVPATPRTNTPVIDSGEIWDMEVIGSRVFIAGSFTSIRNKTGNTTPLAQPYLAAYDYRTGQVDRTFRPTFDGSVSAVEASPSGRLYVGGRFHTVNGVIRNKVARLNVTTGAAVSGFTFPRVTDNPVTALEATDTAVYVGGRFTRINGVAMTGLVEVDGQTGVVDPTFDNQLSGGIGVGGALTVQDLVLTHDEKELLVVHTGRKIDGQDRLGVGLISTTTQQLLPWRTRLWDQYLPTVGGVQRIYTGDIAPDDSYFVVASGSGGDRPPISDTAIAFPIAGGDFVEPLWVARCFDSVYSVAITEQAVYIGGHFQWNESPTANQPWPGLDNVGYGTGQGLSGYGLGDQVVRRDHLGALDPATGTALEWNPGSNSFEGNKAMLATNRGLFVGGDGNVQGGVTTGRVAFYDFATVPAPTRPDTTIKTPIEGRVVAAGTPFSVQGRGLARSVKRVNLTVRRSGTAQYLQDDLQTWGGVNSIRTTLGKARKKWRPWSVPLTLTGTRPLTLTATTVARGGKRDTTPATKTFEVFNFDDQTPNTSITGPSSPLTSTSFTVEGTANDDHGVDALRLWFRDAAGDYLQDDGTVSPIFNTFRGLPDIVGATDATWSFDVTLPHDGQWRGSATAVDTAGQSDLRSSTRDWLIAPGASAPAVTIEQPMQVATRLSPLPTFTVEPGQPITFSGAAIDTAGLRDVEIYLRNYSTQENLGADGTWGTSAVAAYHRITPLDLPGQTHTWSYTTPFNASPGLYVFYVRATNDLGLTTSSLVRPGLNVVVQVAGDAFPDTTLTNPGTGQPSLASNRLDVAGTATDDFGVAAVDIFVYDQDSGRYLQDNGTLSTDFNTLQADLDSTGSLSTGWTFGVDLPGSGDFTVRAVAVDSSDQRDPSSTGASGRYLYFPGDAPPGFVDGLGQPVTNSTFSEGRIVVTGRAEDDISIAKVETAIVDSSGRYLDYAGNFLSTTPSWRAAFLNSPGSPGSNFSYTSPVISDGTYTVLTRATDHHDQIGEVRTADNVTVTRPVNAAPVADFTFSCTANVCAFDGRSSTDENPNTMAYSWSFGSQGSASGPTPTKTFTSVGSYDVTLTVTDEWRTTSTKTTSVAIDIPPSNAPPVPVIAHQCLGLTCSVSAAGSTDPNAGDQITYSWSWGDASPDATGTSATHAYASGATYTITLTATDGWGASASTTRTVTIAP